MGGGFNMKNLFFTELQIWTGPLVGQIPPTQLHPNSKWALDLIQTDDIRWFCFIHFSSNSIFLEPISPPFDPQKKGASMMIHVKSRK